MLQSPRMRSVGLVILVAAVLVVFVLFYDSTERVASGMTTIQFNNSAVSALPEKLKLKTETDNLTHRESFTQSYKDSVVPEKCEAQYNSTGKLQVNLATKLKGPLPNAFGFLTPDSFVIGLGGLDGTEDTGSIIENYDPWMIIFEPMPKYVEKLRARFRARPKVSIVPIGFHATDTNTVFRDNGGGTSFFDGDKQKGSPVKLRNGTRIFERIGLDTHPVDLLHVDCEGCEFHIMEELIRLNWVRNFRHIYLETHTIFGGVKQPIPRYCRIRAGLSKTHINLSHQYLVDRVWVDLWVLKETHALYYLPENMTALLTYLET